MADLDFGIQIEPQFGFTYDDIKMIALEAERLGFESLWVSDHFFLTKESIGTNCLECYTTLTALARDTTTLRLGPMVAGQNYRSPALHANIAASLDHISGGRLNFGIGTGWKVVEYGAYGYEFPKPMARIRQLEETIEIAKAMWTQEKATYRGRYYSVEDAPHPRLGRGHRVPDPKGLGEARRRRQLRLEPAPGVLRGEARGPQEALRTVRDGLRRDQEVGGAHDHHGGVPRGP